MLKRINWPNNPYKYLLASILIVIPLYPKFPFIRVPGTFVSIRLEDLILLFSAILLFSNYIRNFRNFLKNEINKSIFIFILTAALSLISAIFVTKTTVPHIGILHLLRRIEYFIPFFLGYEAVKQDQKNIHFYFKLILIVVFIVFIYGIGQRYLNWPIIITQNEEYSKGVALRWIPGSHINSTFAGHYDLSTFLVLVLPIVVCSLFVLKGNLSRMILILAGVSGLWLLVNSASRISLVSYLISASFSLFLIKKYKEILIVVFVSILFVGFSSNLVTRYGRLFNVAVTKVKSEKLLNGLIKETYASNENEVNLPARKIPTPTPTPRLEDRSTNIRLNVEWPRAVRAFRKNPLLGTGYSSITLATDDDYLRLLGETGILGFLAFSLVLLSILGNFVESLPFTKNFKSLNLSWTSGVFGSLPGILLNALFIDIFEASKFALMFWSIMGITISILKFGKDIDHGR